MRGRTRTQTSEKTHAPIRKPHHAARALRRQARQVNSVDALARARALPASELRATDLLALQRTVGNQAVQRLLSTQASPASSANSQPRLVQAKLVVGPVDDPHEREADRIAEQVASGNDTIAEPVQRQADEIQTHRTGPGERSEADGRLQDRLNASRGNGNQLPDSVRSKMESAFGTDFDNVRIHHDAEADRLNRGLNARAFTRGSDIYFAAGAYNPNGKTGARLLAHELTHVVQQSGARTQQHGVRRKVQVNQSGENVIQRVALDPGLASLIAENNKKAAKKKDEDQQPQTPGTLSRIWNWFSGKKQTAYDPVQPRQKPALISSGIGATGSVTNTVATLTSVLPSVSSIAAKSGGGSAAGILGTIAGPVNAVSGIYNALKGETSRQKFEGGLSSVGGLGQTFSGTALAVDSVSKLAKVASTGTKFMSAAVLPAQIAMSAVDVVRGIYGGMKAGDRDEALGRLITRFPINGKERSFAIFAQGYQAKRKRTAELNMYSGMASGIGGALLLTGIAAPAGIALLALGGLLKLGSLFGGWLRDKIYTDEAKKKRETEDTWTQYVDDMLQPEREASTESRNVIKVLQVMGMHAGTLRGLKVERNAAKRFEIIRTLIMRR